MHEKLVKFGYTVLGLCEQTDRQTDIQTHMQSTYRLISHQSSEYFATLPGRSNMLTTTKYI